MKKSAKDSVTFAKDTGISNAIALRKPLNDPRIWRTHEPPLWLQTKG